MCYGDVFLFFFQTTSVDGFVFDGNVFAGYISFAHICNIRNRVEICLAACMSKHWNKLMNMNDGRHVKEPTQVEHKHRPWPDIHNLDIRKQGVI